MDATLVEAQARRPRCRRAAEQRAPGPNADWPQTHRGRRPHFGHKAHVRVDAWHGAGVQAGLTPAGEWR